MMGDGVRVKRGVRTRIQRSRARSATRRCAVTAVLYQLDQKVDPKPRRGSLMQSLMRALRVLFRAVVLSLRINFFTISALHNASSGSNSIEQEVPEVQT